MSGAPRITAVLALLGVAGCQPSGAVMVTASVEAALGGSCTLPELAAFLLLPSDGTSCLLHQAGDRFEGQCSVPLEPASIELVLEYRVIVGGRKLPIARASRSVTLSAGRTSLAFAPEDLDYKIDQDRDGLSNLDEVCYGRDPFVADAPRLLSVRNEQNSVALARGTFLLGERIALFGERLPSQEHLKVTMGPLLGNASGRVEVPIRSASADQIAVQVPVGLDTTGKVIVSVTGGGLSWTQALPIVRGWAGSAKLDGKVWIVTSGSYASTPNDMSAGACLVESCGAPGVCKPRLWDIDVTGRALLGTCTDAVTAGVYLMTLPTRETWTPRIAASGQATARFVRDGKLMAVLDPAKGTLSTFRVIADEKRTEGPVATIGVAGAVAFGRARGSNSGSVFILLRGAEDVVARFTVGEAGALTSTVAPFPLGACAGTCTTAALDGVDEDRVVVVRDGSNDLQLIDLVRRTQTTVPLTVAPSAVQVSPRTASRVYFAYSETSSVAMGICSLSLDDLKKEPSCGRADSGHHSLSLTVVPEETQALLSSREPAVLYFLLGLPDLKVVATSALGLGLSTFAVQP